MLCNIWLNLSHIYILFGWKICKQSKTAFFLIIFLICHSLLRKVILGQVFWRYIFCQAVVYALFRRSGDFTRNLSSNLLFRSIFSLSLSLYPFHYLSLYAFPFHFSLLSPSLLLSFSLSLLSIILFGVSNGRFRPYFWRNAEKIREMSLVLLLLLTR